MLDLTFLSSLIAVADTGSIASAARQTRRPPSTIASHIDRLSEEVGRPLLRRAGRTVELTRDGDLLVAEGRALLLSHDNLLHAFGRGKDQIQLRLGMPETVRMSEIIRTLAAFKSKEDMQIEIRIAPSADLRVMLRRGEVDVAIALSSKGEDILWRENLVWAGHSGTESEGPLALVNYPLGCPYREMIEERLTQAKIAWREAFTAGSAAILIEALSAGLGLSALDRKAALQAGLPLLDDPKLPALPTPSFSLITRNPRRKTILLMELLKTALA